MIIDFLFYLLSTVVNLVISILPSTPEIGGGLVEFFSGFAEMVITGIGIIKFFVPSAIINILLGLIIFEFGAVPAWKLAVFVYDKIPFKAS